ncbi:MAG: ribosome small subunit-dependent GTPase A [Nitrospinota bacterium]
MIIAHYGKWAIGELPDRSTIKIKPSFKKDLVVGDNVVVEGTHLKYIVTRRNLLERLTSGGKIQKLASNLDQIVIVTATGNLFRQSLIDRLLVAANKSQIDSLLVLNKIDLKEKDEDIVAYNRWGKVGIPFLKTSAITREGIDQLRDILKDKISVLIGQSGVGKSSLFNLLSDIEDRATKKVNLKTSKGVHTTTFSLMTKMSNQGSLIDSAGIRNFAPVKITPLELASYFPGFTPYIGECKFKDCLHHYEPGCRLLNAVAEGRITKDSYNSYLNLLESITAEQPKGW